MASNARHLRFFTGCSLYGRVAHPVSIDKYRMAVRSTAAPLYIAYAESHFVGKPLDSCSHIAMGRTRTKEQPLARIVAIETFDDIARSANIHTTSRCTMLQRRILLDHKVQNLFCSIIPALVKWYSHNLYSAKIATAQREKVAELTQKKWRPMAAIFH